MKIKILSQIEKQEHKIKLLDGELSPTQATDIISSLIIQKIKFNKLEIAQNWERNHKYDQEPLRNRIKELEDSMNQFKDFMLELRDSEKKVKIDGVIKISVVE